MMENGTMADGKREEWATDEDDKLILLRQWHRACGAAIWTGYVWRDRKQTTLDGVKEYFPMSWESHYFAMPAGEVEIHRCAVCDGELAGHVITEAEFARLSHAMWESDVVRYERHCPGRGGHAAELVAAIYFEYVLGASLSELERLWARSRQTLWEMFHARRLPMRADSKALCVDVVEWKGRKFAPHKRIGYLRATDGERELLHVLIWQAANGPVPDGFNVCFRDGNRRNVELSNLFLEKAAETLVRGRTRPGRRVNQFSPVDERRVAA